jgi:D-amino peptidase
MKIYICTDMEGVSGVVSWDQVGRDSRGAEYESARRLLTEDVNSAVAACKEAGAKEVVVLDGHGSGYNFIVESLLPGGRYIVGGNRKTALVGLDRSFDGVILLGYHSMAGTENGVLDHTQSSKAWYKYSVDGAETGEIGQCAIWAGAHGVPVIMVTGDSAACKEAKEFLKDVETVSVKEGYSRTCAKIVPPSEAREMIAAGVKKALKRIKSFKPHKIKFPAKVSIEFQTTDIADGYERGGWRRLNGTTVEKIIEKPEDGKPLWIF